jgi:peptidoglycan/LPS O-acetylase OafA/YrhL
VIVFYVTLCLFSDPGRWMSESQHNKKHWASVQILRGIAVILVALYHFEPHFRVVLRLSPESGPVALFGFFGVDLFFVTSGFVIWPLIAKVSYQRGDRLRFLAKRALRVYVPYLVVVAIMLYYGLGNPNADIAKSLLLYPQGLMTQYLPVAWTLVCEIVFYLVAFGLMFIHSVRWRYCALAAITLAPILHAAVVIAFTPESSGHYYLYWVDLTGTSWLDGSVSGHFMSLWFLEFFAGVSISHWMASGHGPWRAAHAGKIWIGAAAWLSAAILVSHTLYGSLNNGTVLFPANSTIRRRCCVNFRRRAHS